MKFFVAHREFKKIALGASLLLLSILIGVLGFTLIEGFGLVDAFYMAIITFSTVGFNEVVPLSQAGRQVHYTTHLSILGQRYCMALVLAERGLDHPS